MPAPKLAAAAAALALAAITAACATTTSGTAVTARPAAPTSAPAAAAPTAATPTTVSDEDQVRQTMLAFQDAYNTQNWDAYTELMCTAMRTQFTGPVMDYVKKGRAETGLTHLTITAVAITGDTAIVTMSSQNEAVGTRTVTMPLKREDGWKVCRTQ